MGCLKICLGEENQASQLQVWVNPERRLAGVDQGGFAAFGDNPLSQSFQQPTYNTAALVNAVFNGSATFTPRSWVSVPLEGKPGVTIRYLDGGFSASMKRTDQGNDWLSAIGFGLGVGEVARQGKVYEVYGRSAQAVENALSNEKFIYTNGKTYSQGFRGNQYLSAKSVSNSISTAKLARNLGRGMTGLSVGISLYEFSNSNKTGADFARLGGAAIITGSAFIPVVGPAISIGLGFANSFGAFDGIYNSFGQ